MTCVMIGRRTVCRQSGGDSSRLAAVGVRFVTSAAGNGGSYLAMPVLPTVAVYFNGRSTANPSLLISTITCMVTGTPGLLMVALTMPHFVQFSCQKPFFIVPVNVQ